MQLLFTFILFGWAAVHADSHQSEVPNLLGGAPPGNMSDGLKLALKQVQHMANFGVDSGIPNIQIIAAPIKLIVTIALQEAEPFDEILTAISRTYGDIEDQMYDLSKSILCSIGKEEYVQARGWALTFYDYIKTFYYEKAAIDAQKIIKNQCAECGQSTFQGDSVSLNFFNAIFANESNFAINCIEAANFKFSVFENLLKEMRFIATSYGSFTMACRYLRGASNISRAELQSTFEHSWQLSDSLKNVYYRNLLKDGIHRAMRRLISQSSLESVSSSAAVVPSLSLLSTKYDGVIANYENVLESYSGLFWSRKDGCDVYSEAHYPKYTQQHIALPGNSQSVFGVHEGIGYALHRSPNNSAPIEHKAKFEKRQILKLMSKFYTLNHFAEELVEAIRQYHQFPMVSAVVFDVSHYVPDKSCVLSKGLDGFSIVLRKETPTSPNVDFKNVELEIHVHVGY